MHRIWNFIKSIIFQRPKTVYKHSNDGAVLLESELTAKKLSQDGSEAHRVIKKTGHSVTSDLTKDGRLDFAIEGPPSTGEFSTLDVCTILIQRLRHDGEGWGTPYKPPIESGIDCIADGKSRNLQIQVTRAVTDGQVWKWLSTTGNTAGTTSIGDAVEELRRAIHKKETIPPLDRGNILLALDATLTTTHSFDAVTRAFRDKYQSKIAGLGFYGIWLVGPTPDLCTRLDK